MYEYDGNHDPTDHDYHDRLMDCALAEVVGGETPPDLSERILSAASTLQLGSTQLLAEPGHFAAKFLDRRPLAARLGRRRVLRVPGPQARAAHAHRRGRRLESVTLLDHQPHRGPLELFTKTPLTPRPFLGSLAHPSDLRQEPLSGPRRCPKVVGYRTWPSTIIKGQAVVSARLAQRGRRNR
jgi:hypothetical protein